MTALLYLALSRLHTKCDEIIIILTFVLNAPIIEEHHIGARSARRESVNLKQAGFQ